jgi:phosphocarrier protein HPr
MDPITEEVTLKNKHGLHARPATVFVETAKKFTSSITITCGGEEVDGKSIISILTLGLSQGAKMLIQADGDDAREALDAIINLMENHEAFTQ